MGDVPQAHSYALLTPERRYFVTSAATTSAGAQPLPIAMVDTKGTVGPQPASRVTFALFALAYVVMRLIIGSAWPSGVLGQRFEVALILVGSLGMFWALVHRPVTQMAAAAGYRQHTPADQQIMVHTVLSCCKFRREFRSGRIDLIGFNAKKWLAGVGPLAPRVVCFDFAPPRVNQSAPLGESFNTLEVRPAFSAWALAQLFTLVAFGALLGPLMKLLNLGNLGASLIFAAAAGVVWGIIWGGDWMLAVAGVKACSVEPGSISCTGPLLNHRFDASRSVLVLVRGDDGLVSGFVEDQEGVQCDVVAGVNPASSALDELIGRWNLVPLEATLADISNARFEFLPSREMGDGAA